MTSPIDPAPIPQTVKLRDTLYYSLGNAAGLMTYNVFNTFLIFFYTDVVRLPAAWVGAGWLAFGFWNAVNDPIAGWLSDRTQSQFGRRRFFIRALAIPVSLTFALVWLPPLDVDTHGATAVMIYFLVIISIYDILQSIITLNQDAIFPEMYQEHAQRTRAATIRQVAGGISTAVALGASPAIYDTFGWGALALTWGSIAAMLHLLSLRGIKENPAFAEAEENPSIIQQLRLLSENRIFRIVVGINFVTRFILATLTLSLPFYAEYVLEIEQGQSSFLIIAVTAAGLVSLLFWQQAFRRIGTRRAMLYSLAVACVVAMPMFFITSLVPALIALLILGLVVGGIFFLGPDLLFAETIDEDFTRTGVRREGIYRGVLGFVFRLPPALAGFILLNSLDLAGFDADLGVGAQPDLVPVIIQGFIVIGCVGAALAGLALLSAYPLHGERLARIQQEAEALRTRVNRAKA
ncbi:MAG: MFS transporter [Anaerolineales bacterium]